VDTEIREKRVSAEGVARNYRKGGLMVVFDDIIRLFACISLIVGAMECFAGFKMMKSMLAIWGLLVGTMLGVIVGVEADSLALGFVLIIIFGVALAVLSYAFYSAGIFVLTAFLTMVAVYVLCENIFIALAFAICVGALAVLFGRHVCITVTAISGAVIVISSAYLIMDLELSAGDVAMFILWIPTALAGLAVQYITASKVEKDEMNVKSSLRSRNPSRSFSERKYPGMQRAYRNFCIKCGCELFGVAGKCPRCGYSCDE